MKRILPAKQLLNLASLEWEHPPQFDAGIDQCVIVDQLDEAAKRGMRTRIVRFAPGAATSVPYVHDYHEEVYLVSGDQIRVGVANGKANGEVHETHLTGAYFVRPAGTVHGPFTTRDGCFLLEIHYYDA
jgi:hypothetical protein